MDVHRARVGVSASNRQASGTILSVKTQFNARSGGCQRILSMLFPDRKHVNYDSVDIWQHQGDVNTLLRKSSA